MTMQDDGIPVLMPSTPAGRKTTKAGTTSTSKVNPGGGTPAGPADSDDEGDEEMVDLNAMKAFARWVTSLTRPRSGSRQAVPC